VKAAGIVCFADVSVLLLRRSAYVPQAGMWSIPAGTVERGESSLEAALRELSEESGYYGRVDIELSVVDQATGFHYFVARTPRFAIRLNWEHDDGRWCSLRRPLPRPLYPGLSDVLRLC
jgi:8-oxo-dGTP pyrophosphatase MutT (NUDIX family)